MVVARMPSMTPPSSWIAALALVAVFSFAEAGGGYDDGRPPRITEHPVSAVVPRHDPVTLSCKADGRPAPNVSWTKDGERLAGPGLHRVLLPGGNLFFLRAEPADAGVYRCVASNGAGQAVSKDATLEVAFLRHDFRLLPTSQLVSAGETTLLQCGPPRGRPEPTVFWKKDGRRVDPTADKRVRLVDGANLAIQGARAADSGRYQCVAQNAGGVREAPDVLVQVAVPPSLQKGPQDTTALVGTDVEFPCSVAGDPSPDVLWRRSSEPPPGAAPGAGAAAPSGAPPAGLAMPLNRVHVTEARALRISNVQLSDAGQYICEADNKAGALNAAATLTVISMPVLSTSPPGLVTVEEGGDAVVECGAQGSPAPSLFWALKGNRSLLAPGTTAGRFSVERSPQGTAVLTVRNLTRADTGAVLVCSAVNSAGALVAKTRLLVLGHDEVPPPVIENGPSNQTLPLRSSVVLPCTTSGKQQATITWFKDDKPLVGKGPRIKIEADGSLSIQATELSDSGEYKCVASSKRGHSSLSAWLTLSSSMPDKNEKKGFPPGPPSRPHVVSSTNTSITLAWRRNNKAGSSALIGYQVEMFGPEKDGWEVVAQRVPSSTYTQKDLIPGVAYSFVIRAENSNGFSQPSELTIPIVLPLNEAEANFESDLEEDASVEDGPVVRLSQVIPVSASSVKLLWEVLDPDQMSGLSIYWRSVNEDTLHTLSVLQSGPPSLGFIVTGLNCYTKYQFFLVPFNNVGEGRPSNIQGARTLADAPTAPPAHLEAHFLNVSTVSITWSPPPAVSHNGLIESYEVVVKGGDPPELLSNVTLNADPTGSQQLLLSNLSQQVTYHVVVAAATSAGRGPFSTPIIFQSPAGGSRQITNSETTDTPSSNNHPTIHREPGVSTGGNNNDLVTETWFMALLGSMVAVMVLLFSAILFLHRRQHRAKKGGYPHLHMYDSRSNGGVLSLKGAEAEVEVEGAPLCIAPRPGARMVWGTNTTLSGGGSISGPEYAEARPLRSDCQGSVGNSEYAEVKSKYSLLSTFHGHGSHPYPHSHHSRPHSGCRGIEYSEGGGCCGCDYESTSQCCSGSGSGSGASDGSGSTVAYATTTLVESVKAAPSRVAPPSNLPFPSLSWSRSCGPTVCTPQTKRPRDGHYSDTYQQNDISRSLGQKRTATTLNLKGQQWLKGRNNGSSKNLPPHPPPSQLQSGLAFLRTPQYNDYAFCHTSSPLRD